MFSFEDLTWDIATQGIHLLIPLLVIRVLFDNLRQLFNRGGY